MKRTVTRLVRIITKDVFRAQERPYCSVVNGRAVPMPTKGRGQI